METMTDKKREALSYSWALIVALKTAASAAFTLSNDHLRGRSKQRAKSLYSYLKNWLNTGQAKVNRELEEYDDLIEDNASAGLELLVSAASVPNDQVDWFIEQIDGLVFAAQNRAQKDVNE